MVCTRVGAIALLVLFASAVLNIVSFILPMWTTSDSVNASLVKKLTSADFAAGLWGFCTDVELTSSSSSSNDSRVFNHCYLFHTPTKYNLTAISPSFTSNFSDHSVCDGYKESQEVGEEAQLAYSSALAYAAGMNDTTFAKFLDTSCGSLGHASLAFGTISMSAGVFAFVALLLGVTCRKTTSFAILLGRIMVVVAFFATLLMIILWLVQSRMLNDEDEVALSGSFELSVSAAVLYLVALAFVAVHKDKVDDLDLVWAGPLYLAAQWG